MATSAPTAIFAMVDVDPSGPEAQSLAGVPLMMDKKRHESVLVIAPGHSAYPSLLLHPTHEILDLYPYLRYLPIKISFATPS